MTGLLLFLPFLLCTIPALALPTLEEARALLSSPDTQERTDSTRKIWQSGTLALPLLKELIHDPHPEVSGRAAFILKRFEVGLLPSSAPELLALSEALDRAHPNSRTAQLIKLLEHQDGSPIALKLLNHWTLHEKGQLRRLQDHSQLITEALLEHRRHWEQVFTCQLSPSCRAAIITQVDRQNSPMKRSIIAMLAAPAPEQIYRELKKQNSKIAQEIIVILSRLAIIKNKLPLAMQILSENLATAKDRDLARALAFLEKSSGIPAPPYGGKWQLEFQIYQARLNRKPKDLRALSAQLTEDKFFQYENHLISGSLSLPENRKGEGKFPNEAALTALHSAFATPPQPPDIEALSAETLLDWTDLARTLTLLSSPHEAAETLLSHGQPSSAISLLWHSGKRSDALRLAEECLHNVGENRRPKIRLTLSSLHLKNGDTPAAQKAFNPLIQSDSLRETEKRKAISLGLKIFPRAELLPLAPKLNSMQASQRAPAISSLLPYPDKVSIFWYEYFLAQNPGQTPLELLEKVENFLSAGLKKADEIVRERLATASQKTLLPSDSLYQNALFLKLPESLELVKKAAWHQLSIQDLLRIIQDPAWPEKTQEEALQTAFQIDPIHPALYWHSLARGQPQISLAQLHHLTLGDPRLSLTLAALSKKRESLKLAVEVADLRDANSIRSLSILAKSLLAEGKAPEAARLYQAALCGEIAIGTHPPSSIPTTLKNLANYLEARRLMAQGEASEKIWQQRLQSIRKAALEN